jgi:hypothetical protein
MRNRIALTTVLALSALAFGCSRKAEVQVSQDAGTTQKGDEWSWADASGASGPSAATAPPSTTIETPTSHPIETPPPPPTPSRPATKTPSKPTNRLETPPEEHRPYEDEVHEGTTHPAPEPKRAYTAPAGTSATVHLDTALDSATAQVGQEVSATLAADLTDSAGDVVLPAGTHLTGSVTEAVPAKKVDKKSALAFQLNTAHLHDGTRVPISMGTRLEGKGWTKKDGAIIGGSAAGGALLGQILGGDTKSTAAGAVLGGAIGSGVSMSKKGEDVSLPASTEMSLHLEGPVTVER